MGPLVDEALYIVSMRLGSLCDQRKLHFERWLIAQIAARAVLQCNSLVDQGLPC